MTPQSRERGTAGSESIPKECADLRASVERALAERDTVRHELARTDVLLRDTRAELRVARELLRDISNNVPPNRFACGLIDRYFDSLTQPANAVGVSASSTSDEQQQRLGEPSNVNSKGHGS